MQGLYASMWNRQREAAAAREKLELVDDEVAAPNRNPPVVGGGPLSRRTAKAGSRRRSSGPTPRSDDVGARSIRAQLAPIHREGLPFVGVFAVASLILFWLWSPPAGSCHRHSLVRLFLPRSGARDPVRDGIVVAPADGRVSRIVNAVPAQELGLGERRCPGCRSS